MRALTFAVALSCAAAAGAQFAPTRCQTASDQVFGTSVKILLGCDDAFTDNVLWHLDRIDQTSGALNFRAYRGATGAGSVIYIVDTGVLAAHDEFMTATSSRVIAGIDVVPATGNPCQSPDHALQPCANSPASIALASHGSGAASIAGGKNTGVAPEASLVSVRILGLFAAPTLATLNAALDAVIANALDPRTPPFGTAIVNLSFSVSESGGSLAEVEQKIRAMTAGIDGKSFFFTVAAGNAPAPCTAGGAPTVFPQRIANEIDGMVLVGGSTAANTVWPGSCAGEVYAPAEQLLVASSSATNHYRGGGAFLPDSGTSWAAPVVAGIAARMLEREPQLSPAELEARLRATPSTLVSGERVPVFLPPSGPRRRSARH